MPLSSEAPYGVLAASVARTATWYTPVQTNDAGYRGIIFRFKATADPASASVVFGMQYYDEAASEWVSADADMGVTIDAVEALTVSYYAADELKDDDIDSPLAAPLPVKWRLVCTHTDSDSITYSIAYIYCW